MAEMEEKKAQMLQMIKPKNNNIKSDNQKKRSASTQKIIQRKIEPIEEKPENKFEKKEKKEPIISSRNNNYNPITIEKPQKRIESKKFKLKKFVI